MDVIWLIGPADWTSRQLGQFEQVLNATLPAEFTRVHLVKVLPHGTLVPDPRQDELLMQYLHEGILSVDEVRAAKGLKPWDLPETRAPRQPDAGGPIASFD